MRFSKNTRFLLIVSLIALSCVLTTKAEAFIFQDRISLSKSLAHYTIGQMYDLLGLTERAALEYEISLQYDEASFLTHLRLGSDYARLGMVKDSVEELELVHQHNPEDLQSHYLLALIYTTNKEYDKAADEYEYILKKFSSAEPENIEIYGYLGQLYYSQKKYEQAIIQFEKILNLEPKNADVMYLLGSLYLEVDNEKKAIEVLKRAIKIDPEHDGCLNSLGYLYTESGENLEEAEKLINQALDISPKNGAYLDSLGWLYYQKGMYDKALDILLEADQYLIDHVIYDHIGDVYQKMNKTEDAVKYWKKSLEVLPDQKEVIKKLDDIKNITASTQP